MAVLVTFGLSFVLFWVIFLQVNGANILMFPVPVKSHALELGCLAEVLVSRGNEVYFMLHEDQRIPGVLENYKVPRYWSFPERHLGLFRVLMKPWTTSRYGLLKAEAISHSSRRIC